jgi:hypothetical protein
VANICPYLFLDTQQWNYLLSKEGYSAHDLATAREQLIRRVKAKELIVVGSLPLLQELMGTATNNPAKYEQLRQLAFEVVQHRWLCPLNQRYVAELLQGGRLPENGCYLGRPERRKLQTIGRKSSQVRAVADETHEEFNRFKTQQDSLHQEVLSKLGDGEKPSQKDVRKSMEQWWQRGYLEEWVSGALEGSKKKGYLPADRTYPASQAAAPSLWAFMAYKLARIKLNLGEQRAIKASDYFDADHYGCSPYVDGMITDDKPFRETCELIGDEAPKVGGFETLLEVIQGEPLP